MLAKHDTAIKAKRTVLGFEPAMLNKRVINIRSMLVLLNAAEIVKPPIRSMMVGANMTENICLGRWASMPRPNGVIVTYLVASEVDNGSGFGSADRTTLKTTKRNGTSVDVTKSGIA